MLFGDAQGTPPFGFPSQDQMFGKKPGYVNQQGLDMSSTQPSQMMMGQQNPYSSPFSSAKGMFSSLMGLPTLT